MDTAIASITILSATALLGAVVYMHSPSESKGDESSGTNAKTDSTEDTRNTVDTGSKKESSVPKPAPDCNKIPTNLQKLKDRGDALSLDASASTESINAWLKDYKDLENDPFFTTCKPQGQALKTTLDEIRNDFSPAAPGEFDCTNGDIKKLIDEGKAMVTNKPVEQSAVDNWLATYQTKLNDPNLKDFWTNCGGQKTELEALTTKIRDPSMVAPAGTGAAPARAPPDCNPKEIADLITNAARIIPNKGSVPKILVDTWLTDCDTALKDPALKDAWDNCPGLEKKVKDLQTQIKDPAMAAP